MNENGNQSDHHSPQPSQPPPFTVFTRWQRCYIVFLAAFAGMFSPMSSFIFYPAISSIASGLGVSIELVNLSVTTYMVVSGIMPALLGNAADKLGRRPIYIFGLSLYFVANIGLALQNSLPALLALRMIQSAGSSGMISLGYGIISDVVTPAERGFYVGLFCLGPNVAPPIGPIIGGALAARLGWKWIFWFLCILGAVCLLVVVVTLPETARCIVGNGSIPAKGMNRAPILLSGFLNPVACLQLLLRKDVATVLLCNGIYYMTYCCVQASLSTLFLDIYELDALQAGLVYIPFGVACLVSVFTWGKILDYEYSRTAKRHGFPVDVETGTNLPEFPLEEARLRSSFCLVAVATGAIISYGWVLERETHIAVPLVLQAVIGFTVSSLFVALGTLNTDLNADLSATAAASANIIRCTLAATALAVLQIMIDRIGVGWCFTFFGLTCALCGPLLLVEVIKGPQWRDGRLDTV